MRNRHMYVHMTRVSKALMSRRVLSIFKGEQRVKEQSKQEEVTAEVREGPYKLPDHGRPCGIYIHAI